MTESIIEQLRNEVPYPTYNPAFVPVQIDPNTVNFRVGPWAGPAFTLRDTDEDNAVSAFIERIDGETHVDEIVDSFSGEQRRQIAELVHKLYQNDIIINRASEDDELWPHLALRKRFHNRDRERLNTKQILLIDCGRMGIQIATDLVDAGVDEVSIVRPLESDTDPDRIRDEITSTEPRDLEAAISVADFVVYAADQPHPEIVSTIDEIAHTERTPWTSVQIHGFDGFIGPTIFPTETACYHCFRERTLSNVSGRNGYERFLEQAQERQRDVRAPGFGRMLAGYLVMDLVNVLSFGTGYTAGRVVRVDGVSLSMECNDVLKLPRCTVCGIQSGDGPSQFIAAKDVLNASDWMEGRGR